MKFLFTRLFWRENSKAGALVGLLLGVIVLTVLVPALVLAIDVADVWFGVMRPHPGMMTRCFMLLLVLFFYGGLLILLFLRDAWETAFKCSARVAGWWSLLGVVIPVAGVLVPCALRMGRAKVAVYAGIGTLCCLACVVVMALDMGWNTLFVLALTCCCACWVMAINGMPGRRAGAWAWAAPVVMALVMVLPELAQPLMDTWIERETTRAAERGGLNITWNAMMTEYTGGLQPDTEPYATLFATKTRLPSISYWLRDHLGRDAVRPPEPRERELFTAYLATNATAIALVDTVTADEIEPVAHNVERINAWVEGLRMPNIGLMFGWFEWYAVRLVFAAHDNDVAGVLDALTHIERIRDLQRRSPFVYGRNALLVDYTRVNVLQPAIPLLPDAMLVELQDSLTRPASYYAVRLKNDIFRDILIHKNNIDNFRDRYASEFYAYNNTGRFLNYMSPWHLAWHKFRLVLKIHGVGRFFTMLDTSVESGADGVFGNLATPYKSLDWWTKFLIDRSLSLFNNQSAYYAALADKERLAAVAIAVERYRRAHGDLPENTDALVPKFFTKHPMTFSLRPPEITRGEIQVGSTGATVQGFCVSKGDTLRFIVPER